MYTTGWRFLEAHRPRGSRSRAGGLPQAPVEEQPNFFGGFPRVPRGAERLVWVNWRGLAEFEDGVAVRMAGSLGDLAERGSSYDALTSLPGRPLFRDRLAHLIALHQNEAPSGDGVPVRDGATMFAVLLLDLNRFVDQ
ncbi:MAG: hypothetical protein R3E55_03475 [Burkholderiaceae bacterium]